MQHEVKSPYPREVYERNSQIYKMLANPIRLEILNTIKDNEATVEDLAHSIGIRKANTSQHLAVLRHLRLVKVRRSSRKAFYTITNPQIVELCRILKELWES